MLTERRILFLLDMPCLGFLVRQVLSEVIRPSVFISIHQRIILEETIYENELQHWISLQSLQLWNSRASQILIKSITYPHFSERETWEYRAEKFGNLYHSHI